MELRNRCYSANDEADWIRAHDVVYSGGGWWRIEMTDSHGTFGMQTTFKGYRSERDAERDAASMMEAAADNARADCATDCGTDGEDPGGNGNFACGVTSPHGIHVHVFEDGNDVTQDYFNNGA